MQHRPPVSVHRLVMGIDLMLEVQIWHWFYVADLPTKSTGNLWI